MQNHNQQPGKKDLRNFALITGGLTPIFFGLLLPWHFERNFPTWPWIVGGILILWGLVHPGSLKPIYRVWMAIGHGLGWVNSRIILSIMFYLIILPVGLIMRLTGKDPMRRGTSKEAKSYRVPCAVPDKKHMERPF